MIDTTPVRIGTYDASLKTAGSSRFRTQGRLAPVVGSLSRALDLSTGQPDGHSLRTCLLGMRIAAEIGLPPSERGDLFYGLLLKDCGCSGNASKTYHAFGLDDLKAKRDVKITDWPRMNWESVQYAIRHVAPEKPFLERSGMLFRLAVNSKTHARQVTKIRCERGASLARLMGLSVSTAVAILNLDEHWDGRGNPDGLAGTEISLLSRIALLAQTLEIFLASAGPQTALDIANRHLGTWFDPDLVKAVNSIARRGRIWSEVTSEDYAWTCMESEPEMRTMESGGTTLEKICLAFANIIDAKSPFSSNHSVGVANSAVAIARTLGLSTERTVFLRHAALLHDLGKLGVSNAILEKPAALDAAEWKIMRMHPFHTWSILRSIPGFREMSEVAGSHHERLDGSGYFRGLTADQLSLEARILAVADVFDALSTNRPYRNSIPPEHVFEIMAKETPHALDPVCFEALKQSGAECNQTFMDLQTLSRQLMRVETWAAEAVSTPMK